MKPVFDFDRFGADVATHVRGVYGGNRQACRQVAGLNPAMLSRAAHGRPLSVATVLHLCASLGLNPWRYYDISGDADPLYRTDGFARKDKLDQPVTEVVSRETRAVSGTR